MDRASPLERALRGVALALVVTFFLFPIVWIVLMSLQTNATILRMPPSGRLRAHARQLPRADHRAADGRHRDARDRVHSATS